MAVAGSGVLACSRARSTCNRGSAASTHPNAACAISSRPHIGASASWLRRGSCTPLAAPPPREQIRRRCRLAVQPQAGLYSLPPDLYGSLQTGCGLAFLLGLCFSALPILTGDSLERNVRRYQSPDTDESAENIRWSVMGVLSVLPFINPMAWVFAALDDEEAYLLYYSLAFIYALPYVANGFELDGFALLALLICTLHVQLERIAQTEPVEVELPSVLRRLVGGIPKAVRSLGRYSSRLGTELGGRTRSAEDARKRRPDRKYLEERSRETRAELESFDKRRRERSQQQERLWQEQAQQQQQQEQQEQEQQLEKQQLANHQQQQKRQKGLRDKEQER